MRGVSVSGARVGQGPAFMGRRNWPSALEMLVRIGAGAVMLYAGAAKALNLQGMELAVHGYRLAPAFLERPIAYGLPWLEVLVGGFLLAGLFTRFAGAALALVSLVFIVAMAQALARGLHTGCGCFGSAGGGLSWLDLLRDLPLFGAGVYLAVRKEGPGRLDRLLGDPGAASGTSGTSGQASDGRGPHGAGWLRIVIPTALVIVVMAAAVGVAALTAPAGTAGSEVQVSGPTRSSPFPGGAKLPEFSAPALGGGQISWASYRGTPTVLVIWAPWCTDCEAELPRIVSVARQFPAVKITSIVTATGEDPGPTPARYMATHHYTFPVALDSASERLADVLGVSGFPVIYYVYPDGTIYRVTIGAAPQSVVQSLMTAITR